jgi:hypothetical protein
MPQVELALQLYRDHELVKFVLEHAKLPEGAPRIALALERSPTSPHVLVTRDGKFVTCLGEGMAFDLPVISREKLDSLAERRDVLQTRLRVASEAMGARGGAGKMLARIYEAGNLLSREEMVTLGGLQPLFDVELMKLMFACTTDLRNARASLLRHLKRASRLKPDLGPLAKAYWRSFWAVGHFAVLSAMSGPALIEKLQPESQERLATTSYSWGAVRQGVSSLALRGIWATARIGKSQLAVQKRSFREGSAELSVADAGMSLLALGTRHARLRAEALKTLGAGPAQADESPLGRLLRGFGSILAQVADQDESSPEEHRALLTRLGALIAVISGEAAPKGSPYAFEREEDVPEDLALTFLANVELPFLGYKGAENPLMTMFAAVPWVARAAPVDLYLPAAVLRDVRRPWTLDDTAALIHGHRLHSPQPNQTKAASRQSPCPCGSGKKLKRCCGT